MNDVLILVHRHDVLEGVRYYLLEIAEVWREQGLRVAVKHGPEEAEDARVAVLHVDSTVAPEDHLEAVRQYPKALNESVEDISKRHISRHVVQRDDDYAGEVVVKTDKNYGGRPEARMLNKGPRYRRKLHHLRNRLPWQFRSQLSPSEYRIFPNKWAVPKAVWHNLDLVVERFQPERDGEYYCLRTCVFLGDKWTNSLWRSRAPIVKSSNVIDRESVPEVPEELQALREELGFDFGKFDYGIVDGRVVLYDANRTPALSGVESAHAERNKRHLAEGIWPFLQGRSARPEGSPTPPFPITA